MSSLLDVLHKRPPRSQALAVEAVAPAQDPEPEAAAPAATVHVPELRLAESPAPVRGDPSTNLAPAAPVADTGPARRWSDSLPSVEASPVREQVREQARAQAAAGTPATGSRRPLVLAILAAVIGAAGYLAFQFAAPPEDGFLAAPADVVAPAPLAQPDASAAPAAQLPVVAKKKPRRTKPVPAADDALATTGEGEVPWYDQPALPAAPAEPAAPVIEITRGTARNPVFDTLREAYAALVAGDDARAEALYREVAAAEPANADALLGLGALAARGGRTEEARDLYRSVQRLDPRNAAAAAALSALPGAAAQAGSESELKAMLREQPESAALHFALGLRYVADQRWPDAQSAFFDAVRNEPTNPDYAFNLAVSLDRLGQARPAASYYRRALDLATGGQRFDVAAARARLAALEGPQG